MNGIRPLVRCLAVAFGGSVALASVYAQQQSAPAQPAQKQERIEVTGSNIKRLDAETAAPIQVITRDEIERSGKTTVTDILRESTANAAGGLTELTGANSFSVGAASVSLRGLGSAATLVLLNGRRIAPNGLADPNFGQSGYVNVNSLPLEVVERIEILKDGASAIYGSEAIAGVVNVILRKNFRGAQIGVSGGANIEGEYKNATISGSVGFGNLATDRFNVFTSFEAVRQDNVMFKDVEGFLNRQDFRDVYLTGIANSSYSPFITFLPGTGNAGRSLAGAACPASQVVDSRATVGRPGTMCLYDQWAFTEIRPKTERSNIFVRGTLNLTSNLDAFAEVNYNQSSTYYVGVPRVVGQGTGTTFNPSTGRLVGIPASLPAGHPNNPFRTATTFRARMDAVGPQDTELENDSVRALLGLKGVIAGWDFETGLLYSQNEQKNNSYNEIRNSVLTAGINQRSYNFINTTAGALKPDDLRANTVDTAESSFAVFDAKVSGELFTMPAGPASIAAGLEYRKEEREAIADPLKQIGDIVGRGIATTRGEREVKSLYAELVMPVFKGAEVQLAARHDRYSDYGTSTTPKIALSWKPTSNLLLRGSYAEGFRAPSMTEITRSTTTSFFNNVDDPRRCNRPRVTTGCGVSIPNLSEANPLIKPEEAKSATIGFVFEPTRTTSVSVDLFRIRRENEIARISLTDILLNEGSSDPRFVGSIVRDPTNVSTLIPNDPGAILFTRTRYDNLGFTQVKGIDLDARTRFSLGTKGSLTTRFSGTYYTSQSGNGAAGEPAVTYNGSRNSPRWRASLSNAWTTGPWTTTLTVNMLAGFQSHAPLVNLTGTGLTAAQNCGDATGTYLGVCRVADYFTTDLGVQYRGIKNLTLRGTVRNLLNERPSMDPLARPFNVQWYSPQGTNFVFGATYKFY
jgi:iron complex outermembrane recepter protein